MFQLPFLLIFKIWFWYKDQKNELDGGVNCLFIFYFVIYSVSSECPFYCYSLFFQLDYKVDDAKLREVFRLAGQLVNAEVTKDRDGRSRGFGVAEFEHPVESVQVFVLLHSNRRKYLNLPYYVFTLIC